jgi:hypothetical protein
MNNLTMENPYDVSTALGRDRAALWDVHHGSGAFAEHIQRASVTRPMPVDDATRQINAHAIRVIEMCAAARQPLKASGFIERRMTTEQVASALEFGEAKPWAEVIGAIEGKSSGQSLNTPRSDAVTGEGAAKPWAEVMAQIEGRA